MGWAALRRTPVAVLLAAAVGLAAAWLLKESAAGERAESLLYDAQVRGLRARRADGERVPGAAEFAIVGIDSATLEDAGLPLAMIHLPLAAALQRIARAGPRAIALDLVLPDHGIDRWIPGADEALASALAAAQRAAPLVFVVEPRADGTLRAPYAPFAAALGGRGAVTALVPVDGDGVVRRFDPALSAPGAPALAAALAGRLAMPRGASEAGWIDFVHGEPFSYVPLSGLAVPASAEGAQRDRALFGGRVVLVGAVLPFVDRVRLPVALAGWDYPHTAPPAVLVHAQLLRSALGRGMIHDAPAGWIALAAVALLACGLLPAGRLRAIALAAGGAGLVAVSTAALDAGWRLPLVAPLAAGVAAAATLTVLQLALAQRERARLTAAFAGYVSAPVLQALLDGRIDTAPRRRPMAFVFADLRGFTPWSEAEPAERVFDVLNRYFAIITPRVHALGGSIDNFRGDGIMILFGAPEPHPRPCDAAFEAARAIVQEARAFFSGEPGLARHGLDLAVGIAYGEAVCGDLGSDDRRDFTAIGDAANVAARLQDLAKSLDYPVLMTMQVVAGLQRRSGEPACEGSTPVALGRVSLRGHSPVEIAGWRPGP